MQTVEGLKKNEQRDVIIERPFYSGKRDEKGKPIIYEPKAKVTLSRADAAAAVSAEKAHYAKDYPEAGAVQGTQNVSTASDTEKGAKKGAKK